MLDSTTVAEMPKTVTNESAAIKNNFFGGGVNVAGLVCGGDLIEQLKDKPKGDIITIPSVMLRDGEDIFLDDVTLAEAEKRLGRKK